MSVFILYNECFGGKILSFFVLRTKKSSILMINKTVWLLEKVEKVLQSYGKIILKKTTKWYKGREIQKYIRQKYFGRKNTNLKFFFLRSRILEKKLLNSGKGLEKNYKLNDIIYCSLWPISFNKIMSIKRFNFAASIFLMCDAILVGVGMRCKMYIAIYYLNYRSKAGSLHFRVKNSHYFCDYSKIDIF